MRAEARKALESAWRLAARRPAAAGCTGGRNGDSLGHVAGRGAAMTIRRAAQAARAPWGRTKGQGVGRCRLDATAAPEGLGLPKGALRCGCPGDVTLLAAPPVKSRVHPKRARYAALDAPNNL